MRTPPRVMPALITPFDADGELDGAAHRHNVAFLSELGIEGFVLGGSNGEGPYLEPGERRQLIEGAKSANPDTYLMAGIMAETVRGALAQIDECGDADSLLVMTPTTLTRRRPQHVLGYFQAIARVATQPIFLYSVPPNTAYSLELDIVAELGAHPHVAGMKDSSGDVVRLQAIVDATPDDFLLYSGASAAATAALTVGCHGVITGSVNYVPRLVVDTIDQAPSRPLQRRLTAISGTVDGHGVPGVKAASAASGLQAGIPRLPLAPASPELAAELAAAVNAD